MVLPNFKIHILALRHLHTCTCTHVNQFLTLQEYLVYNLMKLGLSVGHGIKQSRLTCIIIYMYIYIYIIGASQSEPLSSE